MKRVLTIAGSDCSGGAGIQADLKTITAHKMYGMSVITALTAQNTMGVTGVLNVEPDFVAAQLDAVFSDIIPDAVKIGMVSQKEIITVIVDKLEEYQVKNIVVDPVMISTSGSKLLSDDAMHMLKTKLIPLATVITPNLPEAECLCGFPIETREDMLRAGEAISEFYNGGILIKGGHLVDSSDDLLISLEGIRWYREERIDNPNTHGTGCTLSSAIACNMAEGKRLEECINSAKGYITGALKSGLNLGKGNGPVNHMWSIK